MASAGDRVFLEETNTYIKKKKGSHNRKGNIEKK